MAILKFWLDLFGEMIVVGMGWLASNNVWLLKRTQELLISNQMSPFWSHKDNAFFLKCPGLKNNNTNK